MPFELFSSSEMAPFLICHCVLSNKSENMHVLSMFTWKTCCIIKTNCSQIRINFSFPAKVVHSTWSCESNHFPYWLFFSAFDFAASTFEEVFMNSECRPIDRYSVTQVIVCSFQFLFSIWFSLRTKNSSIDSFCYRHLHSSAYSSVRFVFSSSMFVMFVLDFHRS